MNVTGPTIARWNLGTRLAEYRRAKGADYETVARELDCSTEKVKRFERGVTPLKAGERAT